MGLPLRGLKLQQIRSEAAVRVPGRGAATTNLPLRNGALNPAMEGGNTDQPESMKEIGKSTGLSEYLHLGRARDW